MSQEFPGNEPGAPFDPTTPPPGPTPGGSPSGSKDDNTWALLSHIGSLPLWFVGVGFVAPLIVLLTRGKESAFVKEHATESLNFNIAAGIAFIVSFVLTFVIIGLLTGLAAFVVYLVFTIQATMKASSGESYRYPISLRLVK